MNVRDFDSLGSSMDIREFDSTTVAKTPSYFPTVEEFLHAAKYMPTLCVDFVIMSCKDDRVYLGDRGIPPCIGWSFIGGRRYAYETLAISVRRILQNEMGLLHANYLCRFISCSEVQWDSRHDVVWTYVMYMPQDDIENTILSIPEYRNPKLVAYEPTMEFHPYHAAVLKQLLV